jgi:Uma2 family endonuclease
MSTVAKRWTYDDLAALPDDDLRHEIIDGEHVVSPSPFVKHQVVVLNFGTELSNYVRAHPIGRVFVAPCDIVFAPDNVAEPDVFYVSNERRAIIGEKNLHGAPDLTVEVLSATRRRRDEVDKRAVYERFGVIEYWIADPDAETVRIYRRGAAGTYDRAIELRVDRSDVLTSPLFPQLAINLPDLFR